MEDVMEITINKQDVYKWWKEQQPTTEAQKKFLENVKKELDNAPDTWQVKIK